MNFDIDSLLASTAARSRVIIGHQSPSADAQDKTAKGAEVGFVVVGTSSDEYSHVSRQIELLNIQQAAERQKRGETDASELDMTTEAGAAMLVDRNAERRMLVAMACTVDWFGFAGGPPFDRARLEAMLKIKPLWVKEIVNKIEDDENFIMG